MIFITIRPRIISRKKAARSIAVMHLTWVDARRRPVSYTSVMINGNGPSQRPS
jgi:hypothetical protein